MENITDSSWEKWGPYLTDRQWGTVREDYSATGSAWESVSHDMARSKAYRWGEEGIAGFSDDQQLLCLAISFWNKKDPLLKERYFGLTGVQNDAALNVLPTICFRNTWSWGNNSYKPMMFSKGNSCVYAEHNISFSIINTV